jgi:hypothetical protein
MKFTRTQWLLCLILGPILGLEAYVHEDHPPWQSLSDPLGAAIAGVIWVAIIILLAKLIKKGWNAVFRKD